MNARFILLAASLLLATSAAFAERADRNKPMHLEASRLSIDDAKKIQILEGDVVITKGTMVLKADRIVITEDQYGFQLGTAFGGPGGLARFRQKREGRDDYLVGEAERIEYNSNSEIVELFHRAWVRSGEDEIRGDHIWYDAVNDKYLVTAGEKTSPSAPPPRVRVTIQPKSNATTTPERPETNGPSLELKGATGLGEVDARP
ncbi:MAG: lipopolysaccharide transport periplasmic protein LptA [Azonexus sp.]|jgi:lipopolysaccharide export system protein LptA|uniref:lipopolysaccharide transport periplasmic protein LptA n=1 Tax=Azonexus sp. TaxID=1872668 RepID=UPI002822E8D2|nr:lipopolysaccharide transport periplasmic protein LptA [Azonexus sp.]MDR0775676.1 lipopolysaccharide transport periplasmic protein LptA [Azonexus sp.]